MHIGSVLDKNVFCQGFVDQICNLDICDYGEDLYLPIVVMLMGMVVAYLDVFEARTKLGRPHLCLHYSQTIYKADMIQII